MAFAFPVMLDVSGKPCLVIGSGGEADAKARALEDAGAAVRRETSFDSPMLNGVFLVVVTGGDTELNARVFAEGEARGVLVNCLDDPPRCRFAFPSIHRQGELVVSVSSGGACPALAVRLRQQMEWNIGPEYGAFLSLCREYRNAIAERVPEFGRRRELWYRIVDSGILGILRDGNEEEARARFEALICEEAGGPR